VKRSFGYWGDGLFLTGCVAYGLNRWLIKPRTHLNFLHSYFNDLWLIPCALPLLLCLHVRLRLRTDGPPTFAEIAGHLALWSVMFEWWGPRVWPRATGDPLDVVCYCVGGLVAWAWWNKAQLLRVEARPS
jgi:hypothetical protein